MILLQKHYRPDIDGLRALSIMFVLIFHAFPQVLQGGFIGVDIFFVISGFLITSILLKTMDEGTFTFFEFYARRVKRLYPCLLIVMVSCLFYGWIVLFPEEFKQLNKHVMAGAFYVNNIVLYKESGYFDAASHLKPLLHLWSLGIEEQFYLVWPLMLYFLKKKRKSVGWILLSCLSVSFLLNLVCLFFNKFLFAFYMPMTRFWELLVGAGLSYLTLYKQRRVDSFLKAFQSVFHIREDALRQVTSLLGVSLIFLGVVLIDDTKKFPGAWALLPTGGAFLVIFSGPKTWCNAKILSHPWMVGLGLISYPLYLWHWPLLSFPRIIKGGELSFFLTIALLGASVVLAYLTYKLLETPVRKRSHLAAIPLLSGMAPLVFLALLVRQEQISSLAASQTELMKIASAINAWDYPGGLVEKKMKGRRFYEVGDHPKKALFFGDSNMEQYGPRMRDLVLKNGSVKRSAVFLTAGGCPPLPNVYEEKLSELEGFVDAAIDYAQRPEVEVIVIAAQWTGYLGTEGAYFFKKDGTSQSLKASSAGLTQALNDFTHMIKTWTDAGKTVYVVLNMPTGAECDPSSFITRSFWGKNRIETSCLSLEKWREKSQPSHAPLRKAALEGGAHIIDPALDLCPKGACLVITEQGYPLYKDGCHLHPTFVSEKVTYLDKTLF